MQRDVKLIIKSIATSPHFGQQSSIGLNQGETLTETDLRQIELDLNSNNRTIAENIFFLEHRGSSIYLFRCTKQKAGG